MFLFQLPDYFNRVFTILNMHLRIQSLAVRCSSITRLVIRPVATTSSVSQSSSDVPDLSGAVASDAVSTVLGDLQQASSPHGDSQLPAWIRQRLVQRSQGNARGLNRAPGAHIIEDSLLFATLSRPPHMNYSPPQQELELRLSAVNGFIERGGYILRDHWEILLGFLVSSDSVSSPTVVHLLQMCGPCMIDATRKQRVLLADTMWSRLAASHFSFGLPHYNELLSCYVENGHTFDPKQYMNTMKQQNFTPNGTTYEHVVKHYARNKDLNSVISCFNEMKEQGIPATAEIFHGLAESYALSGNVAALDRIKETMSQNGMARSDAFYAALLRSHASTCDVANIKSTIQQASADKVQLSAQTYLQFLSVLIEQHKRDAFREIYRLGLIPTHMPNLVKHVTAVAVLHGELDLAVEAVHQSASQQRSDQEFLVEQVVRASSDTKTVLDICERVGLTYSSSTEEQQAAVAHLQLHAYVEVAKLGRYDQAVALLKAYEENTGFVNFSHFYPLISLAAKRKDIGAILVIGDWLAKYKFTMRDAEFRDFWCPNFDGSFDDVVAFFRNKAHENRRAIRAIHVHAAFNGYLMHSMMLSDVEEVKRLLSTCRAARLHLEPRVASFVVPLLISTGDVDLACEILLHVQDEVAFRSSTELSNRFELNSVDFNGRVLRELLKVRGQPDQVPLAVDLMNAFVRHGLVVKPEPHLDAVTKRLVDSGVDAAECRLLSEQLLAVPQRVIPADLPQQRQQWLWLRSTAQHDRTYERAVADGNENLLKMSLVPKLRSLMQSNRAPAETVEEVKEVMKKAADTDFELRPAEIGQLIGHFIRAGDRQAADDLLNKLINDWSQAVLLRNRCTLQLATDFLKDGKLEDCERVISNGLLPLIDQNRRAQAQRTSRSFRRLLKDELELLIRELTDDTARRVFDVVHATGAIDSKSLMRLYTDLKIDKAVESKDFDAVKEAAEQYKKDAGESPSFCNVFAAFADKPAMLEEGFRIRSANADGRAGVELAAGLAIAGMRQAALDTLSYLNGDNGADFDGFLLRLSRWLLSDSQNRTDVVSILIEGAKKWNKPALVQQMYQDLISSYVHKLNWRDALMTHHEATCEGYPITHQTNNQLAQLLVQFDQAVPFDSAHETSAVESIQARRPVRLTNVVRSTALSDSTVTLPLRQAEELLAAGKLDEAVESMQGFSRQSHGATVKSIYGRIINTYLDRGMVDDAEKTYRALLKHSYGSEGVGFLRGVGTLADAIGEQKGDEYLLEFLEDTKLAKELGRTYAKLLHKLRPDSFRLEDVLDRCKIQATNLIDLIGEGKDIEDQVRSWSADQSHKHHTLAKQTMYALHTCKGDNEAAEAIDNSPDPLTQSIAIRAARSDLNLLRSFLQHPKLKHRKEQIYSSLIRAELDTNGLAAAKATLNEALASGCNTGVMSKGLLTYVQKAAAEEGRTDEEVKSATA